MDAHGDNGADSRGAGGTSDEARRRRLLALLAHDDPASSPPGSTELSRPAGAVPPGDRSGVRKRLDRVCVLAASEVGVDGVGVTVMASTEGGRRGSRDQLSGTGALTRRLEDLQLTAGEGPCLDAYDGGLPVLAGDLAAESSRWLGFGPEAVAAGAAAVFSLPLQVGAVRLGTLDLNRSRTGTLSREQLATALVLAGLATEALLEIARQSDLGDEDRDGEPQQPAGWLPDVHADVHVASGMVSVQQGIDVGSALLRVRAHAFATGDSISEITQRIVERS